MILARLVVFGFVEDAVAVAFSGSLVQRSLFIMVLWLLALSNPKFLAFASWD